MTSINFKVIGLTRPGFEPARFRFPSLPKLETDPLLIRHSGRNMSIMNYMYVCIYMDVCNMHECVDVDVGVGWGIQ